MFVPPASVLSLIEGKQVRAVAFTGETRPKELPDVPLMSEALPSLKIQGAWHGWLAPAKTPPEVVNRLAAELIKTLDAPKVLDGIRRSGYEPYPKGPAEFAALLKENAEQMAQAVKAAKIEPQ
jgi:tripartite-type tricarboxylate transporter receptor subunit TctC